MLLAAASAASAASISGTVTDASTGYPIAGVQVTGTPQADSDQTTAQVASTHADGSYTLPDLSEGSYEIQFFPFELNYILEYYDGVRSQAAATLVHVSSSESRLGVDAELAVGGQISGQVVSAADQEPLADIWACAFSHTDYTGGPCVLTDVNGNYTVKGLVSDSYILLFEPHYWFPNYFEQWYSGASSSATANWVPVTEGATTTGIGVALNKAAGISGTVSDAVTHSSLRGIEVCAIQVGGEEFPRCRSTSADGQYAIGGMPSGDYRVLFSPEPGQADGQEREDGYFPLYYDGVDSRENAATFSLTAPSMRSGVDAQLVSKTPFQQADDPPVESPPASSPPASLELETFIERNRVRIQRRTAFFQFRSNVVSPRFECQIDHQPFRRCVSPRIYRHLRYGKHIFRVRAIDEQGGVDLTPARYGEFRIRHPRR